MTIRTGLPALMLAITAVAPATAQDFFPHGEPNLSELREIRSTYIVEFAGAPDPGELPGRAREVAAAFDGQVRRIYGHAFNGFSVQMSDIGVARMLEARGLGIVSVTRNDVVTTMAPKACRGPNANDPGCGEDPVTDACTMAELPWGVARVTPISANEHCTGYLERGAEVPYATLNRFGNDDKLINVCVIDTGVDDRHPELNVTANDPDNNFILGETHADLHGHGTHVAGTIGAKADNIVGGVIGVAPGVEITSIKVLDAKGSGSWEGVIGGIDRAAELHADGFCDVANLSLGGNRADAVDNAVKNAAAQGVLFAIAAGNSGLDTQRYSPAAASTNRVDDGIYTIAAFAEGEKWASFSNYDENGVDPIVDFAMPGVGIRSTVPGGGYATYSGTSMAAPHMAGLLVRYLYDHNATGKIPNAGDGGFADVGDVTRVGGRGRFTTSYETYDIAGDTP